MSFTLETHYQPGRQLINSGIPADCPLCGEKELRCYRIRILDFEIFHCDGCGFTGDVLLLHSIAHDESISKVAFSYEGDRGALKYARELTEEQEKIRSFLIASRQRYPASEGQISAILDEWSPAVSIGRNPPFSERLYLADEILTSGHGWIPEKVREKEDFCVALPFYALPGLISRVLFIGSRIRSYQVPFRSDELVDQEEGGCLDLSGPGQKSVLVMTDLFDAISLSRLFCSTSIGRGCPIVVVDQEESRSVWDTLCKDELIFLVGEEFPPVAYELTSRPGCRFSGASAADLSSRIRACGSGGLIPAAREEAAPFHRFVRRLAAGKERELLESIDQSSVPGSLLSRVADEATSRELDLLEEAWPGLARGEVVYWKKMIYRRLPDGGIKGVHRSTGREDEVSDVDFRIDRYLRGPDGLFLAGRLRHRGRDVPFKVPMDIPDGRLEAMVAEAPSMQRGTSPAPKICSTVRRWKRLCLQLSGEVNVEDGAGRAGLAGRRFILPGWVVTPEDIREQDLIARESSCRWHMQARPRRYLASLLSESPGAALAWAGILGLSTSLCASLFGEEPGPVILTGPGDAGRLADELREVFFLPEGPDLPGYPFCSGATENGSLSVMDPWEAHVCGLVGSPHYVIVGGSETDGIRSANWLILRIIQHALRRPLLRRVEDSCRCEMMADIAESYVTEELGAPPGPIAKGAEMIRCGSLLRRGWPGAEVGFPAKVLSLCMALGEREGLERFVEIEEEKVSLHLRGVYESISDTLQERTGGISDGEIAQKLLKCRGTLGAAGKDIILKRGLWDEVAARWKSDCRDSLYR